MHNHLPEPKACDVCQSTDIQFIPNDLIYGKLLGAWPYVWHCRNCFASCGCHGGTRLPLGKMASKQTRRLRTLAHRAFDPIWQKGLLDRTNAYVWLATKLGIEAKECHISWLTDEQLKQSISYSTEYFKEQSIEVRRKAKQDAKRFRQFSKEQERRGKINGKLRRTRRMFVD